LHYLKHNLEKISPGHLNRSQNGNKTLYVFVSINGGGKVEKNFFEMFFSVEEPRMDELPSYFSIYNSSENENFPEDEVNELMCYNVENEVF